MGNWLFQGNPDRFDIDSYLRANRTVYWTVPKKHLASRMAVGDAVYLWRAAGRAEGVSGVVASAFISGVPSVQYGDEAGTRFWRQDMPAEPVLRVRLEVTRLCLNEKEVVRSDWLKDDPILSDLVILRLANATTYELLPKHAQRLGQLTENTGRTWNREECIAALWAYKETYGGKLSRRAGSPIATVALAIGRATKGVYNEVMNFRAIDPRDERVGLTSGNRIISQTLTCPQ